MAEMIRVSAGPCPACGTRRTLHMSLLEKGGCEALVTCAACGTKERYFAASMEMFVIVADVAMTDSATEETEEGSGDVPCG